MKVGDYVRTRDGIKKVLKYTYNEKYENGHCVWFDNKDYGLLFTDEEINKMKPSPNIIDLIEVGDYVNGERVNYIDDCKGAMREFYYTFEDVTHDVGHYEEEIKSIVTKECFESMEYKVKE